MDLFCGAGGLSAGLVDSGMNLQAGFDNSEISLEITKTISVLIHLILISKM